MKIKDRPEYKSKPAPIILSPTTKVSKAVKIMTERNIGSVIVCSGKSKKIKGIVTERDLMTRLLFNNLNPKTTTLAKIMTTEVRAASEDDNLIDWLRVMSNERFRHLPIIDKNGNVISMMSQGDFVSYTWPELLTQVKETAKASLGAGYQIALITGALLIYALIIGMMQ